VHPQAQALMTHAHTHTRIYIDIFHVSTYHIFINAVHEKYIL